VKKPSGTAFGVILKKTGKTGSAVVGMPLSQPNSVVAVGKVNRVQPAQRVTNYACGKNAGKGKK